MVVPISLETKIRDTVPVTKVQTKLFGHLYHGIHMFYICLESSENPNRHSKISNTGPTNFGHVDNGSDWSSNIGPHLNFSTARVDIKHMDTMDVQKTLSELLSRALWRRDEERRQQQKAHPYTFFVGLYVQGPPTQCALF